MPFKIIWLELTERCNLSCPHCLVKRNSIGTDLPLEFYYRLLSEIAELEFGSIEFTGGEPLSRNDFVKIYSYAHDRGLLISVNTNGTLISEEIAKIWKKKSPKAVKVSFYGWDEQSYDTFVQKRGAFLKFQSGLNRIKQNKIPIKILIPPHPMLLKNAFRIKEFVQSFDFKGSISIAWNMLLHSHRDIVANQRILSFRLDPEQAARQRMKLSLEIFQDICMISTEKAKKSTKDSQLFKCVAAQGAFSVNAYGFLQPCRPLRHQDFLYDLKIGTLSDGTHKLNSRVLKTNTSNPRMLNRCCKCILRPSCSSCPATSWVENGVLDEPVEYYCEIMHKEAYWLGLLPKGVKGWKTNIA